MKSISFFFFCLFSWIILGIILSLGSYLLIGTLFQSVEGILSAAVAMICLTIIYIGFTIEPFFSLVGILEHIQELKDTQDNEGTLILSRQKIYWKD